MNLDMPETARNWPASHIETRAPGELEASSSNARTHSSKQIDEIVISIREWGWTMPVLISSENQIIAGHGRVLAAQKLELVAIPVIVARGWSDAQIRAYCIADNKLAENADWDRVMLASELADLQQLGFATSLTGVSADELMELVERPRKNTDLDRAPDPPQQSGHKPRRYLAAGAAPHHVR